MTIFRIIMGPTAILLLLFGSLVGRNKIACVVYVHVDMHGRQKRVVGDRLSQRMPLICIMQIVQDFESASRVPPSDELRIRSGLRLSFASLHHHLWLCHS